jgi:hypothetical protein
MHASMALTCAERSRTLGSESVLASRTFDESFSFRMVET